MSFKNTLLPVQNSVQSKGKLLDLASPVVMGILNATPDSFYTKGKNNTVDGLLRQAETMLAEGAQLLDIGGLSTRPGAAAISIEEELDRVVPVIAAIGARFPDMWLSVDTYNSKVAAAAVAAGAAIVNDVSAGELDVDMIPVVAALGVPYIAMHMKGRPQHMQDQPEYENVTLEVLDYLSAVCARCSEAGIRDLILDPGFGFGKTAAHNYELLSHMALLRMAGKPLLAGVSRKSMIYRSLDINADDALNGTTALHMVALQQGAAILRVHDVKQAVEAVKLYRLLS